MFSSYSVSARRVNPGFTIIEVVVVIGVIGMLVTLTVVGVNSWRARTAQTMVKSDLGSAKTAMENARIWNNGYPAYAGGSLFTTGDAPGSLFQSSGDVEVRYVYGTTASYCLEASSTIFNDIKYHHIAAAGDKRSGEGDCPAQAVAVDPDPVPTSHTLPTTGYTIPQLQSICSSPANAPSGYNVIVSSFGNVTGTSGPDIIYRYGGMGNISAEGGNDIVCTGDTMGNINGNDGNDTILITSGMGNAYGGNGDDVLVSIGHTGRADGDDGNDTVYGHANMGISNGGAGTDRLGRTSGVTFLYTHTGFEEQFTYTP